MLYINVLIRVWV